MTIAFSLALCVFALLASRSQSRGTGSVSPSALALTALPRQPDSSEPPQPTTAPWDDASQQTRSPTGASPISTVAAWTEGTVRSGTAPALTSSSGALASPPHMGAPAATTAPAPTDPSTPGESHFSAPTVSGNSTHWQHHLSEAPLAQGPTSTSPSWPAPTVLSRAHTSTSGSPTTVTAAQTAAAGHRGGPVGPTHQEAPSELNVGDEDPSGRRFRPASPLDPLLAGLLSVFIVTTAFVFIVLFLKFRRRTTHPEFHRLQDLPMDDLMEDTPLSRYAY